MPKTSYRNTAERSSHGVAGARRDDDRRDRPREVDREERDREDDRDEREERDRVERELDRLRFRDGARLTVLRLAIAQMFSSPGPIIPRLGQKRQPIWRANLATMG